ncbi:MAG: hypothetical protein ACI9C4_000425 [Paraglaciecola sp.]|jgi:hypothetical protein
MMKIIKLLLLITLTSGCSSLTKITAKVGSYMPWHSNNQVKSINIFVLPNTSLNRAIKVDVIFVFNDVSKAVIDALEPAQWFAARGQYVANLSDGIALIKWEVVPGTKHSTNALPDEHKQAIAVYIFANNPSNKTQITEIEHSLLSLDEQSITAQALPLVDGDTNK